MIVGTGIDLVSVARIKKIIDKWNVHFTGRIFTDGEMDYCARKAFPAIHYAARFAAKESFLKALGIGMGMGVRFRDIEVTHNGQGKPELICHERAVMLLGELDIRSVFVSLTHTSEYAAAVVILEK